MFAMALIVKYSDDGFVKEKALKFIKKISLDMVDDVTFGAKFAGLYISDECMLVNECISDMEKMCVMGATDKFFSVMQRQHKLLNEAFS